MIRTFWEIPLHQVFFCNNEFFTNDKFEKVRYDDSATHTENVVFCDCALTSFPDAIEVIIIFVEFSTTRLTAPFFKLGFHQCFLHEFRPKSAEKENSKKSDFSANNRKKVYLKILSKQCANFSYHADHYTEIETSKNEQNCVKYD